MITKSSTQDCHTEFEWLPPIKVPLVNKFYKQYSIRGHANKSDQVAVLRYEQDIIAAALLRRAEHSQLLTGVGVAPNVQGRGLATFLLTSMRAQFDSNVFCFGFEHLVPWYIKNGFVDIASESLPTALKSKFSAYQQQGRNIRCLQFNLQR